MNDNDTLEDITAIGREENIPAKSVDHQEQLSTEGVPGHSLDSDIEVFDRIANKLLRSGLLLTALELHAELIERGKELPRLREFFDNPHNFEKQTQESAQNRQEGLSVPQVKNVHRSPSEQTFDSFDFTHYSDDDIERPGDERVAVLEFELRKAQQTINSLRASLTMSTTVPSIEQFETELNAKSHTILDGSAVPLVALSLADSNSFSDRCSLRDYFCRGSADGDSCPGEDDLKQSRGNLMSVNDNVMNVFEHGQDTGKSKYSLSSSIKPHEKRAINYLVNEFLMQLNYKLTSITFCDENADQDFDNWDEVGLNTDRPPDLLRLYRCFWQNCSSLMRTSSSATTVVNNNTTTGTKASNSQNEPFDE